MNEQHPKRAADRVATTVAQQEWLGTAADALQPPVNKALQAVPTEIRNLLHGTWLGHPLHPVLTDIPIGAWTTALALDAADAAGGTPASRTGADLAIGLGLAGAVASAVTGLADWSQTDGAARRFGLAHASCNVTAVLLYGASLALRLAGSRRAGRALSLAGFGAAMAGGYLGGHLAFGEQVGVDHTATADSGKPDKFVAVFPEAELRENKPVRAEADGIAILLVRRGDAIHALTETCPHMGGPLAEGKLEDGSVRCPWHGSRFDLATGAAVEGPTAFPARCFDVRVRKGQIEVRAADRERAQS